MTYLDERDETIQYCLITIFSIATLAVMVYVLFGTYIAAYFAISLYALAFTALCLITIRKLFVINNFKVRLENYEKNTPQEILQEGDFEAKNANAKQLIKSATIKEWVKCILSGTFAIFTIIVLVLF